MSLERISCTPNVLVIGAGSGMTSSWDAVGSKTTSLPPVSALSINIFLCNNSYRLLRLRPSVFRAMSMTSTLDLERTTSGSISVSTKTNKVHN
jgi:hypothetical protein